MVGEVWGLVYISQMKSLTVEEATPGLGRLVELALVGEQIQIRKGNGVVELRPAQQAQAVTNVEPLSDEVLERVYSKADV